MLNKWTQKLVLFTVFSFSISQVNETNAFPTASLTSAAGKVYGESAYIGGLFAFLEAANKQFEVMIAGNQNYLQDSYNLICESLGELRVKKTIAAFRLAHLFKKQLPEILRLKAKA